MRARILGLVGVLAMVTTAAEAAQAAKLQGVPGPFVGVWNRVAADCGTDNNDSALTIAAHRIKFYESSGLVVGVTQVADREIVVQTLLSGEGERWTSTVRFRLSADGRSLSDVTNAEPLTRRRCP